jgi:uncharacterized protein
MKVTLETIAVQRPQGANVIIGQAHFIKTIEDIYEAITESVPSIKFGAAFCEASGACLVRAEGSDQELTEIAADNALRLGCGHMFIVIINGAYPINVLNSIKNVSEVCCLYCASANPLEVIVAQTQQGRSFLGVVDGSAPKGIETEDDRAQRKKMLRQFGYKL